VSHLGVSGIIVNDVDVLQVVHAHCNVMQLNLCEFLHLTTWVALLHITLRIAARFDMLMWQPAEQCFPGKCCEQMEGE
jgi:hypothetical protein